MKKRNNRLMVSIGVLALAAGLTSSAAAQDAAALYKAKCASCHAADGSGDTPVGKKLEVKSFSDPAVAKNSDASWIESTKKGKGKMP
ncbi:MAG TPA: cytochrome c, partial [Candidatus Angelobacter sp.]|nr:cytochrome c [Candidatus Angelobacter sp.]